MGVDRVPHSIKRNSYQPYRYLERDTIPIHHQSFPLYQPLLAERTPSTREELDFDAIPIHRQAFPFPDDAPEGTLHPVAIKTRVLGSPIQERETIQNVNVIGHFISSSNMPLERPPVCSQAVHGDLYIHHYGNRVQIWLRDGNQWLLDIRDGYHHLMLPEYHLTSSLDGTKVEISMTATWNAMYHILCLSTARGMWPSIFKGSSLATRVRQRPSFPFFGKYDARAAYIYDYIEKRAQQCNCSKVPLFASFEANRADRIHPKFPQLAQLLGKFDHDIIIPLKEHFNLTAGREKEPRRDEVNPSKSVWTKFCLSDTLIITVLMFLFVLGNHTRVKRISYRASCTASTHREALSPCQIVERMKKVDTVNIP
ncbi:hypothetical protein EDC04DRAFT_2610542 [Pisolithus marmoratus]|nr:hypothetical protein EDC04DRAFT_2610542 [Pisolithus marmoratus]